MYHIKAKLVIIAITTNKMPNTIKIFQVGTAVIAIVVLIKSNIEIKTKTNNILIPVFIIYSLY